MKKFRLPIVMTRFFLMQKEITIGDTTARPAKEAPKKKEKKERRPRFWRKLDLWPISPHRDWSRRGKKYINILLIVLFSAIIILATVFATRPVRVEKQIEVRTTTNTVTVADPADLQRIFGLKADLAAAEEKVAELEKQLLLNTPAFTATTVVGSPAQELIPEIWTPVTGEQTMALALATFGDIRIKILFSQGSIPEIDETTRLIAKKPAGLTLAAWVGNTPEARNWPIGMVTPNSGGWGTEVFLANSTEGVLSFYSISSVGEVARVTQAWVTQENMYWVFMGTSAYRQ
jgi:hypothetical protein